MGASLGGFLSMSFGSTALVSVLPSSVLPWATAGPSPPSTVDSLLRPATRLGACGGTGGGGTSFLGGGGGALATFFGGGGAGGGSSALGGGGGGGSGLGGGGGGSRTTIFT